jgi:hypothetical protein
LNTHLGFFDAAPCRGDKRFGLKKSPVLVPSQIRRSIGKTGLKGIFKTFVASSSLSTSLTRSEFHSFLLKSIRAATLVYAGRLLIGD